MKFPSALIILFFATPLFAFALSFSDNLSLGSVGPSVLELQKMLNRDADTKVSEVGAGSPGQESSFFGKATYRAVIKFQEKYSSEVLIPFGFYKGTGFVGALTRKKLSSLNDSIPFNTVKSSLQSKEIKTILPPKAMPTPAVSAPKTSSTGNPNLLNLDRFISAVEKVGKQQGYNDNALTLAVEGIKKGVATTTNLRAEFNKVRAKARRLSMLPEISPRPISLGGAFKHLLSFFGIVPAVAKAQAGVPFGGAVYFVFFCDCSENWLIGVEPLPPTYATLLNYYEGTQEYLNYNTPSSDELLGFYSFGAQCITEPEADCEVIIPSEGEITGTLGSSI